MRKYMSFNFCRDKQNCLLYTGVPKRRFHCIFLCAFLLTHQEIVFVGVSYRGDGRTVGEL